MRQALTVEDSSIVRKILRARLQRAGWQVIEASNASEGWELFQCLRPQLVTLDIVMPTIAGYTALDLLRDIRKAETEADVVVISSRTDDREAFLREGAIEFVVKPFENFAGLMRKLEPLIYSIAEDPNRTL
jgi:CheY-like chemotaxis protein